MINIFFRNVFRPTKKRIYNRSIQIAYFLLTLPALVLFTMFFTIPSLSGIYYSMTDWNGISPTFNFIGLKNYTEMLKDDRLRGDLGFTLLYTVIVVVLIIALSLIIALLLNTNIKGRGFFRSIYFFPAVLSLITVGLIFNEIFYQAVPMVGKVLGITALQKNILGSEKTAMYGIIITHVWQGVAIPIVIFLAGLQSVPRELYEAATIDGANSYQRFTNITIPFLIPMLNVNLVLSIKGGLTVFDYVRAMTDGGPGTATESIGLLIFKNGFQQMKFGYGAAESIVLLLLIVVISIIQLRFLNRWEVGQL